MAGTGKLSVYLGEHLERALVDADNKSARLDRICRDYLAVVAQELGRLDLTKAEWVAALDAVENILPTFDLRLIWAKLAMLSGESELAEKWGVDIAALAQKIRGFSIAENMALVEAARRYWRLRGQGLPPDEAMARAGIHPKEG